jgi:hypothetical protein
MHSSLSHMDLVFFCNAVVGWWWWWFAYLCAGAAPSATALAPLPPGWDEHVDPITLRHFYVHTATNETTWYRPSPALHSVTAVPPPKEGAGVPPPPPPSSAHSTAKGTAAKPIPLPTGWEEAVDPVRRGVLDRERCMPVQILGVFRVCVFVYKCMHVFACVHFSGLCETNII